MTEELLEVFDKPWKTEKDHETTKKLRDGLKDDPSYSRINVHKIEDDHGKIISYMKDGVFEVHHQDKDGNSGSITGGSSPNPRYYSTMIKHIEDHGISKLHTVRVTGNVSDKTDMYSHYLRLAKRVLQKKYPHHIINDEESNGPRKSFTISPPPKLEEAISKILSNK